MRIPQEIIDRVIAESDIVDIIGAHVVLSRAGSNLKGLCPFHGENTPSFMVSPVKQIYHCFGCGAGGGVIQFLMQFEKIDFRAAIEKMATRLGIVWQQTDKPSGRETEAALLLKINAYSLWYFQEQLQKNTRAMDYLRTRGIPDELCEKFALGVAPTGFDNLLAFLRGKRVPLKAAEALGLIRSKNNEQYYDFFRDRLMFPIRSVSGKVVGFGGRDLSGEAPAKYVNSSESLVYNKSRELYGLYEARPDIIKTGRAIIVEGYIDVIACAALGVPNTVAPLGTSLTTEQIHILKRLGVSPVIFFDGDEAGKRATLRAIELCFREKVHPLVVRLPENTDPGDLLKLSDGKAMLADILHKPLHAMDWILVESLKQKTTGSVEQAAQIRLLLDWIAKLPDAVEANRYRKKISETFDLALAVHDKRIAKGSQFVRNSEPSEGQLEELLIYIFLRDPEHFPSPGMTAVASDFVDRELAALGKNLDELFRQKTVLVESQLMGCLPEALWKRLSALILRPWRAAEDYLVAECLQKWRRQLLREQKKALMARMAQADLVGDAEQKKQLLHEMQDLLNKLQAG